MSEEVVFSDLVLERLKQIKNFSAGKLFGVRHENVLSVLGFSITERNPEGEDDKDVSDTAYNYDILPNLPANIDFLGFFTVGSKDYSEEWGKKCLKIESDHTFILLNIEINTKEVSIQLWKNKKLEQTKLHNSKESHWKNFFIFHLTGKFTISCNFDLESVKEALSLFRKKVKHKAAFESKEKKVFFFEDNVSDSFKLSQVSLVKRMMDPPRPYNSNILNFNMYLNICSDTNTKIAPIIKYEKKCFKFVKLILPIDTLSLVHVTAEAKEVHKILLESVYRNLTLIENCLLEDFKHSDRNKISLPEIYHFFPNKCGHFISIAYPKKQMEDQLKSTREIFHKVLSLPMDIPIFRKGNVHSFVTNEDPRQELINPHEGLNPSGVKDGEVSLVQGSYGYHHYMQNCFDDSGWGCAYRSLQTIFSWFKLQGFTGKPIPTHKEIQQCLVDIGDKPASFIGSRNWIGSTEVSFVLETLLGITSRIVSVSSGEELSMKGGELSHHFKTQGTPIMIGGGVLAHTILGVDYNRKTGSLKFLILDPHYTGDEDLSIIQGKGWCGWKGMDFWKKNAFYNMCLPLRPKTI